MASPIDVAWVLLKESVPEGETVAGGYGDMFWDRLLLLHHEHGEELALQYLVERGGFSPQEAPTLLAEALNPTNQMQFDPRDD